MSLKNDYEKAMTHLLFTYGSVALQPDDREWQDKGRGFSTGSYYGSQIEADPQATLAFYERLANGARPVYEKCGPSDFGMDNRFNHTFTDTQLEVHYAASYIVLDDDPTPVLLIAGVDTSDFSSMLKWVLRQNVDDVETAIEKLGERATSSEGSKDRKIQAAWYKLKYPEISG